MEAIILDHLVCDTCLKKRPEFRVAIWRNATPTR